jgi:hypothetical protein
MKKIIIVFIGLTFFACNEQGSETKQKEIEKETSVVDDKPESKKIEISPKQIYSINTLKDDTIIGVQGTKIIIPKNSFKSEGEIGKCVAVLREFYSIPDIIQSDLHTVSDKGLLQSKGMFYFNVYKDSSCIEPVELRSKVKLTCQIPTKVTNDYTLFYLDSTYQKTEWKEFKRINDTSVLEEVYDSVYDYDEIKGELIGFLGLKKRTKNIPSKSILRMRNRTEYYFDKFGFINCDRYTVGKTTELVCHNAKEEFNYYAIVSKFNSIVHCGVVKNIAVMNLPVNSNYTLVSYKEFEGGFVSYNISTHFTGDKEVTLEEKHVKVSKEEFNTILTNRFGNNMNV